VSWANHGPTAARVDHVDIRWRGYTGEFPEFSIVE
jgi:acylphosphatase